MAIGYGMKQDNKHSKNHLHVIFAKHPLNYDVSDDNYGIQAYQNQILTPIPYLSVKM